MELKPLYKNRVVIPNDIYGFYCPSCGEALVDGDESQLTESAEPFDIGYCNGCNLQVSDQSVYLAFTVEKYNGWDNPSSHTVALIVNGKAYAFAHIEETESDSSGDVAYMQLCYIPKELQLEKTVEVIRDFAKYIRFDWQNPDKQSDLPTLVRLLGIEIDKSKQFPYQHTKYVALPDATQIQVEHLTHEFTSREVNG